MDFLLMYKRVEEGSFKWPRNVTEALEINKHQFEQLMKGLKLTLKLPMKPKDNPGTLM